MARVFYYNGPKARGGKNVQWDGMPLPGPYGGERIDAHWVQEKVLPWARPGAARQIGGVYVSVYDDGAIQLDKFTKGPAVEGPKLSNQLYYPLVNWGATKCDATVLDPGYERFFGSLHPGCDYNGARVLQGNANNPDRDRGWKVVARATGTVVHAQWHRVWGWVCEIEATLNDGKRYWFQDAHFDQLLVKPGDFVEGGKVIGSVGKAAGNAQPAHLHSEIRLVGPSVLPADLWPSTGRSRSAARSLILENYIVDQRGFYKKFQAKSVDLPEHAVKL